MAVLVGRRCGPGSRLVLLGSNWRGDVADGVMSTMAFRVLHEDVAMRSAVFI
jgi:hypothetical protein